MVRSNGDFSADNLSEDELCMYYLARSSKEIRYEVLGDVVEQAAWLQVVLPAVEQEFAASVLIWN
jgi:prophage maintenance system killer protein